MKKVNIITVVAVLITLVAASCGQNAQKQKQDGEQTTDETHFAYIEFDGETLLVDEFVHVTNDDDELIEKYGLDKDDIYDDGVDVNEVEEYEEWKLLPNATFSVIRYVEDEEGRPCPKRFEVSRDEFISEGRGEMFIIGSRSGVSRIEEIILHGD